MLPIYVRTNPSIIILKGREGGLLFFHSTQTKMSKDVDDKSLHKTKLNEKQMLKTEKVTFRSKSSHQQQLTLYLALASPQATFAEVTVGAGSIAFSSLPTGRAIADTANWVAGNTLVTVTLEHTARAVATVRAGCNRLYSKFFEVNLHFQIIFLYNLC